MQNIAKENEASRLYGFFRAVVMDNIDPKKYGRVRLNVRGVFDDIETEYLPWAVIAGPMFCGSGSSTGSFNVPDVGSHVWCFFEEADHNQPVYFAEATDGTHGLPPERITNYPNRRVTKTKAGVCIYVDDTPGQVEVMVKHPSGSYVHINNDGKIAAHGGDVDVIGVNITVDGSSVVVNGGNIEINGGNIQITGSGISIQGSVDIN